MTTNQTKQAKTTDSLRRDDMNPAPPAAPKRRLVTRHRVCVNGKWSARLYSAAQATKIVCRANRMGFDAYRSVFGKVWV